MNLKKRVKRLTSGMADMERELKVLTKAIEDLAAAVNQLQVPVGIDPEPWRLPTPPVPVDLPWAPNRIWCGGATAPEGKWEVFN